MKSLLRKLAVGFASTLLLVQGGIVNAAELKVLCAAGFRGIMNDLGPKFEDASKHKLVLSSATLEVAVKRLQDGEAADLVILPREGIDTLVKAGKAAAGSISPLARVSIAVAVPKGSPKPDITSPEALKRTLLAAKSITYLDPAAGGASGIRFAKVLDQLGIAKEMKAKTVLKATTPEMQGLIKEGKAEIIVNQMGTLLTLSGIDIVGPLPEKLDQPIVFTAVVMNGAKDAGAAKALVNFLRNPESAKLIKSKGMEPAK